ncbi:MAG: hypothetical protein PVF47_05745 [Anaerolineae bacterium]|jgi:hypothetical protein
MKQRTTLASGLVLLLALLLAACGSRTPAPADLLPGEDDLPAWTPAGETRVYDRESLYDLVDGQADFYFAYGFEQVAARHYANADGNILDVQVWQLAGPEDAYGLFTGSRGGTALALGDGGDADPGRRVIFWQDRYYVQIFARQAVPEGDLVEVGRWISGALPVAPGAGRPALVSGLPGEGLVAESVLFFHEEISFQDTLWLGGQNLLGLGPETDGVLARYELGGTPAWLLLIRYPEAGAAGSARQALEGGSVEGLVAAGTRDDLLAAIWGQVEEGAARELLASALAD